MCLCGKSSEKLRAVDSDLCKSEQFEDTPAHTWGEESSWCLAARDVPRFAICVLVQVMEDVIHSCPWRMPLWPCHQLIHSLCPQTLAAEMGLPRSQDLGVSSTPHLPPHGHGSEIQTRISYRFPCIISSLPINAVQSTV